MLLKAKKVDASHVYFRTNINLSFFHAQMNALFQPNWALIKNVFEKSFGQNSVLQAKIQILVVLKLKAGSKCFFVRSLLFFERIYAFQTGFHSFSCQSFFFEQASQQSPDWLKQSIHLSMEGT